MPWKTQLPFQIGRTVWLPLHGTTSPFW
jgi:hypothetical protein